MRRVIAVILLIASLFLLSSCKPGMYYTNDKDTGQRLTVYYDRFVLIEDYGHTKLVYDKDTYVVYYLIFDGSRLSLTPFYYNKFGSAEIAIYNTNFCILESN